MNQGPDSEKRDDGNAADAPLHEALDDLESMLGPGGRPAAGPRETPPGRAPYAASRAGEAAAPDAMPGMTPPLAGTPAVPLGAAEPGPPDPELYRLTARRLSSELEIIVNARLEAALERLGEELRRELRNHIEIVLPEIVSTLAAADPPTRHE